MFERVTIRASELEASRRFYDTVLATLSTGWGELALEQADAPTQHLHLGFVAASRAEVDDFWQAGTAAGYPDDGPPGPRPQYLEDYYGAFLLDPEGNSAEAVHHGSLRRGGSVDHIWMRVSDVEASKRFYEQIADRAGFRLAEERPGYARFEGVSGTFSLLAGTPTRNAQLGFGLGERLLDPDGNTVA